MASKYGNKKVVFDGFNFDSKLEADYYRYLKNQIDRGEIKYLYIKPLIILQPSFKFNGKTIRQITYTPDFKFVDKNNMTHLVDVKGMKTNEFKLKEKMFKFMNKDYDDEIKIYCVKLHKDTWIEF